jgi:hypothetical protein
MTRPGYDFRRESVEGLRGYAWGASHTLPPPPRIHTHIHNPTHTHMCVCARKKGGFSVAHLGTARTLQPQAYILGGKWAGTGSACKIKSADSQRAAPGAKQRRFQHLPLVLSFQPQATTNPSQFPCKIFWIRSGISGIISRLDLAEVLEAAASTQTAAGKTLDA